jgi:hypothetical protein
MVVKATLKPNKYDCWSLFAISTVVSRLSTHPFKYAFFGKKFRVQDLLVEYNIPERLEAMFFALVMARDGGTGSLAWRMLSI